MAPQKKQRVLDERQIVFFHPDLGIGGAERLIIDAAVGLQELGNKVTIFTSHCDPEHCFEEARDGTLDVRVRGNTIFPATALNRFHILLAILRQIHLVIAISLFSDELYHLKPDVFIVDQLSACVPLLRWLYPRNQRVLFYCHFPDQLLAERSSSGIISILKHVYRIPFDWFEGWSMNASDKIVVNSNFTKSVAKKVFTSLPKELGVVYPCVVLPDNEVGLKQQNAGDMLWKNQFKILLSINRFERKKDIGLAIRAYQALSATERKGTRLILAGGYDHRVIENVQYHKELVELAEKLGLCTATAKTVPTALAIPSTIDVLFLLSVPGPFKMTLLQNARLLLYTPTNEHFGIVPVEAMQYGVPVLAANTGGPLETVVEDQTGWLRDVNKVEDWTTVIRHVLHELNDSQLRKIGDNGRRRVEQHFTRKTMAKRFDQEIQDMIHTERSSFIGSKDIIIILGVMGAMIAALISLLVNFSLRRNTDTRLTEFARATRSNPESAENLGFLSQQVI